MIKRVFDTEMHPVDKHDLVLQVHRPRSAQVGSRHGFRVNTFPDRRTANREHQRDQESCTCVSLEFDDQLQVAVNEFCPNTQPTDQIASGMPREIAECARVTREPIPEGLKLRWISIEPFYAAMAFKKSLFSDQMRPRLTSLPMC